MDLMGAKLTGKAELVHQRREVKFGSAYDLSQHRLAPQNRKAVVDRVEAGRAGIRKELVVEQGAVCSNECVAAIPAAAIAQNRHRADPSLLGGLPNRRKIDREVRIAI